MADDHIRICDERRENDRRENDKRETEMRDRLVRAEQDIKNQKENFQSFKSDDFGSLKTEVHSMRNELNQKIDKLITQISTINIQMAKWIGALGVLIAGLEIAIKVVFK
jgi:hypothetical protein